jgi:hypothetical protein
METQDVFADEVRVYRPVFRKLRIVCLEPYACDDTRSVERIEPDLEDVRRIDAGSGMPPLSRVSRRIEGRSLRPPFHEGRDFGFPAAPGRMKPSLLFHTVFEEAAFEIPDSLENVSSPSGNHTRLTSTSNPGQGICLEDRSRSVCLSTDTQTLRVRTFIEVAILAFARS